MNIKNEISKMLNNNTKSVIIKDDQMQLLYSNERDSKLMIDMFVQRIAETKFYLILFPSGLLVSFNSNPLSLNSR